MTSDAEKALNEAISRMNKKFGDRTVGRLSDKPVKCDVISTGSLALDLAIGVGGVPKKRVTEIFGLPGAGKTTLMQHLIAECQIAGGTGAYIDMEHKLDPTYAQACGVDMESCIFSQPGNGVEALEITRALIPVVDLVVVDSVYDLTTPAEMESDVGDQHMMKLARLMSQELKKIKPELGLSHCALVFVNQVRTGVSQGGYSYHTEPGGYALQFGTSVKIKMRKTGDLPKTDAFPQGSGITSTAYVAKNNVAPPFREAEINIVHGSGIDKAADILEAGLLSGVIEMGGSWPNFKGEHIGESAGKLPAIKAIREDDKLATEIRAAALKQ